MILKHENIFLVYKCELLKIIDGDTLDLKIYFGLGFFCNARIRLKGIDCPEVYHVKKTDPEFIRGKIATLVVKKWFYNSGPFYYVNAEHRDLYGRWLGEIWKSPGQGSLNDYLIRAYYKSHYKNWYHQEPLSKL